MEVSPLLKKPILQFSTTESGDSTKSKSAFGRLCDSLTSNNDWSVAVCKYSRDINKSFPNSQGFSCPFCETLSFVDASFCIQCHRIIHGSHEVKLFPTKSSALSFKNSNGVSIVGGGYHNRLGKRKADGLTTEIENVTFLIKRPRLDKSELQPLLMDLETPTDTNNQETCLSPITNKISVASHIQLSLDAIRIGRSGFFDARQRLVEINKNFMSFRLKIKGVWCDVNIEFQHATRFMTCEQPNFFYMILEQNYGDSLCKFLNLPSDSLDPFSSSTAVKGILILLNRQLTAEDKAILHEIIVSSGTEKKLTNWNLELNKESGQQVLRVCEVDLSPELKWNVNQILSAQPVPTLPSPRCDSPPTMMISTGNRPSMISPLRHAVRNVPMSSPLRRPLFTTRAPMVGNANHTILRAPLAARHITPILCNNQRSVLNNSPRITLISTRPILSLPVSQAPQTPSYPNSLRAIQMCSPAAVNNTQLALTQHFSQMPRYTTTPVNMSRSVKSLVSDPALPVNSDSCLSSATQGILSAPSPGAVKESDSVNNSATDSDDLIIVGEEKGIQQQRQQQVALCKPDVSKDIASSLLSQLQKQNRIQLTSGQLIQLVHPGQGSVLPTSAANNGNEIGSNGNAGTVVCQPTLITTNSQNSIQAIVSQSCITSLIANLTCPNPVQGPLPSVRAEEPALPPRLIGTPIEKFTYNPGGVNGITLTSNDVMCLNPAVYLNDVIIDFYFKYVFHEIMSEDQRKRTHIFNCFFYNRLIQSQTHKSAGESEMLSRHASVAKWTRRVDIFDKDFIIIPINENAHWFLAIVCFPWMSGVVDYASLLQPGAQGKGEITFESDSTISTALDSLRTSYSEDTSEATNDFVLRRNEAVKKLNAMSIEPFPCILLFDSLIGTSRAPNVKVLREYLQVEWNTKRAPRDGHLTFTKETIRGFSPKVPQQPNFSDCGIYVLHYGEMFFTKPIQSFTKNYFQTDMLKWFDTSDVIEKRSFIQDLIIEKYQQSVQETSNPETASESGESLIVQQQPQHPLPQSVAS